MGGIWKKKHHHSFQQTQSNHRPSGYPGFVRQNLKSTKLRTSRLSPLNRLHALQPISDKGLTSLPGRCGEAMSSGLLFLLGVVRKVLRNLLDNRHEQLEEPLLQFLLRGHVHETAGFAVALDNGTDIGSEVAGGLDGDLWWVIARQVGEPPVRHQCDGKALSTY